jgi:multidrug efflux pump
MQKDLPSDVKLDFAFDNTRFIRASINEVQTTVIIAFLLVILVIFVFLRDWRITLIPTLVIPISLIGIFFVMYLAGFSINVLSMLAVVLAVGLVVDDAIVVTENIYKKIEQGMSPRKASIEGSMEIFFAIISTTITLVAIFFPIVFLEGMTGRLFREFSIVIAGAVIISAFVALSFVRCSRPKCLNPRQSKESGMKKLRLIFDKFNLFYEQMLQRFLARKWLIFPIIMFTALLIVVLWEIIPAENGSVGRSIANCSSYVRSGGDNIWSLREIILHGFRIADSVVAGASIEPKCIRSGMGTVRLTLPDIDQRERTQMEIADELSKSVRNETAARTFVQQQSTFGGVEEECLSNMSCVA